MTKLSKLSAPSNPGADPKKPKKGSTLPEPGEVLNYSYLWEDEFANGRDEGVKDRPVAVVLVTQSKDGIHQVHVVPMTTKPPARDQLAIEVPDAVRRDLGLSGERSWIIITEWNRFAWPGYDIRPIPGREPAVSYGYLPASLFIRVRNAIVAAGIGRVVDRD
jgi:hypothetical protein